MADETKTKEQLLAEIEALKKELGQATPGTETPASPEAAAPVASAPSTRRGALRWIAPAILSLGTLAKAGTAQAADDFTGSDTPTMANASPTMLSRTGRCIPIAPTAAPVAPTLGMAAAPDCRPSPVGLFALGSARAALAVALS